MTKTKALIIIISTLIILASAMWLIFFKGTPSHPTIGNSPTANPFGSSDNANINQIGGINNSSSDTSSGTNTSSNQKLLRISNQPVAGFIALTKGTSTVVRFVDRATGHITDAYLPKVGVRDSIDKVRVTNNTLAKVYDARFSSDGNSVLMRFLKGNTDQEINVSLQLTPPKAASGTSTDGLYNISATALAGSIDSVTSSGSLLYYVLKNASAIVSSSFSGTSVKSLYSSTFTDWRLQKSGSDLLVYPKADSTVPGYAYILRNGALNRVAGPGNGLTAISNPSGTEILYSHSDGGSMQLTMKNISRGYEMDVTPVTLAEKCAWSGKSVDLFYCGEPVAGIGIGQPENWYLGNSSFTDRIWAFDMSSEIAQIIVDPKAEFNLDLDVYEPQVSPSEDYLIFINHSDLTLWAVKI